MAVRHAPARLGAVATVAVALLLAAGPVAAIIIQSDSSELCTTNLAACQQQCMSAGQFAFQCDSGGTFGRPSSTCKCVKVPSGVQDSMAILRLTEFSNAPACGSQSWLYDCAQTATAQIIGGDFKIISGDAAASSASAAATASPAAGLALPGASASAVDAGVGMPRAAATAPATATATRQQVPAAANAGGLRMGVSGAPVPVPAASAAGDAMMGVIGSGVRAAPGAVSASAVLAMNGPGGAAAAGGPMGGFGADEGFGRRLQQQLMGAAPAATIAPDFGAPASPAFGAGMGMGAAPAGAAGIPSSDPFDALATSGAALDYGFPAAAAAAAAPPNPSSPKCKQPVQGVVTSAVGGGLMVPGLKQVVAAVAQGNDTLVIQLPQQGCTATFQVVTGNLLSLSAAPAANATAAAKGAKSGAAAAAAAPGALFAAAAAGLAALLAL